MKRLLSAAAVVLSLLLLAAHEFRIHSLAQALAWAVLLPLLATRLDPARRILQAALLAGVLVYANAAVELVSFRIAFGLPYARLILIMAGVCGFIFLSALGLSARVMRERYSESADKTGPVLAVFGLVFLVLAGLQLKLPRPMLILERFSTYLGSGAGWLEIVLVSLYAAWVALRMLDPARSARMRRTVWTLFTVVFFGQLLLGLAGLDIFLMTGKLHLPVPALIVAGPLYRGEGYFMLILFASTVALVGPAWCSHLCYVGAWDNVCAMRSRPGKMPGWRHGLRVTLAVLIVLAAVGMRLAGTPVRVALIAAAVFGLGSVGVMVLVSRRLGLMAHCITVCPIGLLANLAGRLTPWRMSIGPGCEKCGACARVCRYGALTDADLERGRPGLTCSLCGDCVGVCRGREIGYVFAGRRMPWARTLFVVLVVALHAVFLAVARI